MEVNKIHDFYYKTFLSPHEPNIHISSYFKQNLITRTFNHIHTPSIIFIISIIQLAKLIKPFTFPPLTYLYYPT
jgi:hypothetical protein